MCLGGRPCGNKKVGRTETRVALVVYGLSVKDLIRLFCPYVPPLLLAPWPGQTGLMRPINLLSLRQLHMNQMHPSHQHVDSSGSRTRSPLPGKTRLSWWRCILLITTVWNDYEVFPGLINTSARPHLIILKLYPTGAPLYRCTLPSLLCLMRFWKGSPYFFLIWNQLLSLPWPCQGKRICKVLRSPVLFIGNHLGYSCSPRSYLILKLDPDLDPTLLTQTYTVLPRTFD